ncbi:hypothetical protein [Pleionea litopenaei]|uniref:Uncharacterized protein n=1 Tax=Pleionea litopenaei TaxID=3070815 RepID=A0AA51RS41_9GAMM|nr:hypothetical protein [Pleionea sp. HL-JVS1]WMS86580.1 hypothetical protein Q9312_15270 [Pleionea sp. HL-JVS1]
MWTPNKISSKKAELDFSSSGQDASKVTQIFFDKHLFCNAVELLEIEDASIQFLVCEHCGYAGCSPGNWLSLRYCGEFIFLIPSFVDMEEGEWELSEYGAPYYVKKEGGIYLSSEQYAELLELIPSLPKKVKLPQLTNHEVALLAQWEAPYRVLGEFPEDIAFKSSLYLATESELGEQIIDRALRLLLKLCGSKEPAQIGFCKEKNNAIFLDTRECLQWNPICEQNGDSYISFEPDVGFKT